MKIIKVIKTIKNDKNDHKLDHLKLKMSKGKVSNIIASFEENIKKAEGENKDEIGVKKDKVENAFKVFMNSSQRGEMTPSPGRRVKKKRLGSQKPLGSMKLDFWLKKEK